MKSVITGKLDLLKTSSHDVLAVLRASKAPLSAYQILERAHSAKLKNPVQVYRALRALQHLSLVHRVETLNKYVACRCDHPKDAQPVLTICDGCGTVAELPELPSMQGLEQLLAKDGFTRRIVKVEVAGLCVSCRAEESA